MFYSFNYANGTLYGAELVNGGLNLKYKNYDLLTGKQILSVPQSIYYKCLKKDIDCVSKDGKAAYFATNDGLFQFNFNTKKFEKLLDGSTCTLGDNTAHCRSMACDKEGNVYILTTYDRDNHAKTYLYKYAPCSAVSEAPLGSKENPYAIEPYDPEPAD